MKRREFLKGAILGTALLASGEALADEITTLVNGVEIAGTDFKVGGVFAPEASFKIRLDKTSTIEAIENCNLHGRWISDPATVAVI